MKCVTRAAVIKNWNQWDNLQIMHDPVRHKNKKELVVNGTFNDGSSQFEAECSTLVNEQVLTQLTPKQVQEMIRRDISLVRFSPLSAIYTSQMGFQYEHPDALKDFDYGNIFVDAHIPYCLHLPNNYEFEVDMPESHPQKVLLIHRKLWTKKACHENTKSSEVDFYATDKLTYFNHSIILTPKIPVDFEDGWEQNFTGKNIERIKDQNGTFRYSAFYIQFDKQISPEELKDRLQLERILSEIKDTALLAVNRLIDSYRSITRNGYVQRLGTLEINTIYFINLNQGFYILSSGFGIESAIMNRSRKEIVQIENALEIGQKPETYDLLLLDAQTSFENKDLTLAVIQSFQALEIFLENLLFNLLLDRGDSEAAVLQYLDQHRRTKTRLKECLQELKNTTLLAVNRPLWDQWWTLYDQTRNKVVHKGKEPTEREVTLVLNANTKVIEWLKTI